MELCKVSRCGREWPPPAKFFNQQNFAAGGVKAEQEKFGNLATHTKNGRTKEKGKAPRCGKSLPPTQFGARLKILKVSR
jgi:hypothetical protein